MKVIRALGDLLRTLVVGWIVALFELLRRLLALLRTALDRGSLPGRSAKGADSTCVPIRHPSFRRPDPLIYSQFYLMGLGLAVTWDNPDIVLRRGGVVVPSSHVDPDTDYEIVARIWNGSTNAPIVGLPVDFSYLDFGMGVVSLPIGSTKVDLGVKGGPGCPTFASIGWRTPRAPGHYCIQVAFSWIDDANTLNNLGQENLLVAQAQSPAEFEFKVRNGDDERREFAFHVDTYELPDPLPCDAVERPTKRDLQRRSFAPAAERIYPALPERVRALHDPTAYPVPEGWAVTFQPSEVALASGAEQTVRASVEPPPEFVGAQRLNVRAVDGPHVAGGLTLVVEK